MRNQKKFILPKFRSMLAAALCLCLLWPMQTVSFASDWVEGQEGGTNADYVDWAFNPKQTERMDAGRSYLTFHRGFPTMRSDELDYLTRTAPHSMSVDHDVMVADFVHLEIPEKHTLTIEKGATVTVLGQLIIEGKLENHGTLIIGERTTSKATGKPIINTGYLLIPGSTLSTGSVNVIQGGIKVEGGGSLENKGTITISNQDKDLTGLQNGSVKKSSGTLYGRIVNSGTIYVQNDGGKGINSKPDTTFENKGKIYRSASGTIHGTITGNAPIVQ